MTVLVTLVKFAFSFPKILRFAKEISTVILT
uniref:Uncharacterized protein n=1 Tax=Anguilla anguilla TaxID=7936 RepID=A0A0E9PBU5_ANGAN